MAKKIDEKFFKMDDNMNANKIEDILDEGENILLQTKPKRSAYILSTIFKDIFIVLVWLGIDLGIALSITWDMTTTIIMVTFFAFHLLPVWMWLSKIITSSIQHKNIEYVFTEKRIIVRSGVIGIDFKSIYYSDIEGVNLKVGLTDKIFKVGDVYIKSKSQSTVLYDLQNPYKLVSKIQEITHDIKTDIYYPNNLRPEHNDGYKTKYTK